MGVETCGWLWEGFGSWNQEIIIMDGWMFLLRHQEEADGSPVWDEVILRSLWGSGGDMGWTLAGIHPKRGKEGRAGDSLEALGT